MGTTSFCPVHASVVDQNTIWLTACPFLPKQRSRSKHLLDQLWHWPSGCPHTCSRQKYVLAVRSHSKYVLAQSTFSVSSAHLLHLCCDFLFIMILFNRNLKPPRTRTRSRMISFRHSGRKSRQSNPTCWTRGNNTRRVKLTWSRSKRSSRTSRGRNDWSGWIWSRQRAGWEQTEKYHDCSSKHA